MSNYEPYVGDQDDKWGQIYTIYTITTLLSPTVYLFYLKECVRICTPTKFNVSVI